MKPACQDDGVKRTRLKFNPGLSQVVLLSRKGFLKRIYSGPLAGIVEQHSMPNLQFIELGVGEALARMAQGSVSLDFAISKPYSVLVIRA